MENLTIISYIKDLLILKSPIIYDMVKPFIYSAKQKGVDIENLVINPYVFESRSLDVPYLLKYLESLDNLAGIFREIYDEYIYSLRLEGYINNDTYNMIGDYNFHMIFNAINNTFNSYLNDQYLLEDFSIYQSDTSLLVCMLMYDTFNEYFIYSLIDLVDPRKLKSLTMQKSMRYSQCIYDKIFEQFEYIYLPFY